MDQINIGLVGCGIFGESHLQAYQALPQANVAAIFDTDTKRARQMAEAFAVPQVCRGIEEICGRADLQVIDVVTPEAAHLEAVQTGLSAGRDVFVEKPLATDLADCQRMVEAADRAREQILMVGHILRFETKYALLKEQIDAGALGEIVSLHARRNRPKAHLPLYGRVHPALETGIHDIDMMLWYVGRPVRRVRGFARSAMGSQYPETLWGILEFDGGAIGVVETIWLLPEAGIGTDDGIQVMGTGGVGNLHLVPGPLTYWTDSGFTTPDVSYGPTVMGAARGALRDELAYFCECVQHRRQPRMNTPREAMNAVRVAQALIASAETESDIEITEWS